MSGRATRRMSLARRLVTVALVLGLGAGCAGQTPAISGDAPAPVESVESAVAGRAPREIGALQVAGLALLTAAVLFAVLVAGSDAVEFDP